SVLTFSVGPKLWPQGGMEVLSGHAEIPVSVRQESVDARYVRLMRASIRVIAIFVLNPNQLAPVRPVDGVPSVAVTVPITGKRHGVVGDHHCIAYERLAPRFSGWGKPDDPISARGITAYLRLATGKTAETSSNV